jgi:hypothetical protein
MQINNSKIEVVIYFSPPYSDYRFIYSSENLLDLLPSLRSGVLEFLDVMKFKGYFIKSFRSGNVNYIAIGRRSIEVNMSRGQKAPYVYTFILRLSDFLKYHIDLEKLFNKIIDYDVVYKQFEEGKNVLSISSVPIDEVQIKIERDLRLPILDRRGYIFYVKNLEDALQQFRELYRNIWLRILFDFLLTENYQDSYLLSNVIVFSYNNYGNFRQDGKFIEFSNINLDIKDICKYLDSFHNIDIVEGYREKIRNFIDTYINRDKILNDVERIVRNIENTHINRENIEYINKTWEEFQNYKKNLDVLGVQDEYSGRIQRAIKNLPEDEGIELLEYIRQKNIQVCKPLRDALEEYERELDEKTIQKMLSLIKQQAILNKEVINYVKNRPALLNKLFEECRKYFSSLIKEELDKASNNFKSVHNNLGTALTNLNFLQELEKSLSKEGLEGLARKIKDLYKEEEKEYDKLIEEMGRNIEKLKSKKRAFLGFSI